MVILLLLTAAAPALFFIYDLWAVAASLFIVLPFALKKHRVHDGTAWLLIFILAGIFVSARSPASFDSFIFVLQSLLYAAFFIVGTEAPQKVTAVPLAALALVPFMSASGVNNPNIISSYAGLLFVLLMLVPFARKLKYILGALALFFIILNASWVVLLVLASAGILAGKRKYLPLIPLFALMALALNFPSASDRFFWWREALEIFAENPMGIGFFASKYYLPATAAQNTLFVHSFLLQIIAEGGILCLIPAALALRAVLKNRMGGKYDFAVYAVLLLGALDLSYHIPAHGMLAAFIIGLTQKRTGIPLKQEKVCSAVFKILFVIAAALSLMMFHTSRVLAGGAVPLFSGDAPRAAAAFEEAFEYPAYPALLSAKAAAYSIIAERDNLPDLRKRSFELQEKALPAKNARIPAYRDFENAVKLDDLSVLRNSCMKILFINAIRPRH
ncbi:MAG: O-antigen ligase family protein [Elusimicrobiota bacterium]|nr:O-antigen ligase family protein [Elusimicrobiota bacterium]